MEFVVHLYSVMVWVEYENKEFVSAVAALALQRK